MNNLVMLQLLLEEYSGVKAKVIKLDTDLVYDLKIDGDDAFEFFQEYQNRFNVDISNFEYNKFFGPEGGVYIPFLTNKPRKSSLLVSNLVEGIKNGRL